MVGKTKDKRVLTEQQEEVLRLVHHDFEGKTVKEAAGIMELSLVRVYKIIKELKIRAPQMFPILTPREKSLLNMLDEGVSISDIARVSNKTEETIRQGIAVLKKKEFLLENNLEVVSYTPGCDNRVKEKF